MFACSMSKQMCIRWIVAWPMGKQHCFCHLEQRVFVLCSRTPPVWSPLDIYPTFDNWSCIQGSHKGCYIRHSSALSDNCYDIELQQSYICLRSAGQVDQLLTCGLRYFLKCRTTSPSPSHSFSYIMCKLITGQGTGCKHWVLHWAACERNREIQGRNC